MAALTTARNTPMRGEKHRKVVTQVAATTKIYGGAAVCLNAAGFAVPAADTAGLVTWGRAEETADNSAGLDGAVTMEVARGVFGFKHASLTQAAVGTVVCWADDQTVTTAAAATNDIAAGTLEELDGATAWVRVLP